VYFAGGVFYQRTVAHARGWRQLPNYNLWRGIFTFVTVCLGLLGLGGGLVLLTIHSGLFNHSYLVVRKVFA